MVGLQEVRGVGVSHSLLQDRQTGYVQAAGAHISPATCHKIQHILILQHTRVHLFGGFHTQVHQGEELQKEFKLLFHSHGAYVKSLGAFAGIMTRLPTLEANSGVAASPMCTVNIHWSRAILQRLGNRVLCWSSRKHLTCWNKDWLTLACPGLPSLELHHSQKSLFNSAHLQANYATPRCQILHQAGCPIGFQQCPDSGRRQVEGCILYQPRAL